MPDRKHLITRREFGLTAALPAIGGAAPATGPWDGPAVVKKVFIGVAKPTWPRPDLNFNQEMADISGRLAELERRHPDLVRFSGGEWLKQASDVDAWAASLGAADAVLVSDLTSSTAPILEAVGKVDIPKLLFTRPVTGWAFMDGARWLQQGLKADMIASSSFADLEPFLPMLRAIHHVRRSKVLVVNAGNRPGGMAEGFTKQLGTTISPLSYAELKAAYDAADLRRAEAEAAEFRKGALKVVEPSPAEIRDSLRLYLAVTEILRREKANAITVDCLGGFRRGDLPAYPCVAWTRLNDTGLYGVCEADLMSTMTQLLITPYCGKPGFVSDPTFDTSRNEVIHAHCVSATKMSGFGAAPCPYILRSHMEDNKGVAVQVQVPVGGPVTCAKLAEPKKLLVSAGKITANLDSPRGCRTKFVTRVADARKFVENYGAGLHRVLFCGDYVEGLERMGRLTGIQVVREC